MELKNIVEDIVQELISSLDESKGGAISLSQKREIAAYVLNRVKPMYITSNKGFTNLIVKYRSDPQFLADLMTQISAGLKLVLKSHETPIVKKKFDPDKLYYLFPKFYGRVISANDFMPVESAKITLLINSKAAKSLFELWKNPTEILPKDGGTFCFAPLPIAAGKPCRKKSFQITIHIECEDGSCNYDKKFFYETDPASLGIQNMKSDFYNNVFPLEDVYLPFHKL